jgi:hypothetical protein
MKGLNIGGNSMKSEHFIKIATVLKKCGYKISHFEETNYRPEQKADGLTDYIQLYIELEDQPVPMEEAANAPS